MPLFLSYAPHVDFAHSVDNLRPVHDEKAVRGEEDVPGQVVHDGERKVDVRRVAEEERHVDGRNGNCCEEGGSHERVDARAYEEHLLLRHASRQPPVRAHELNAGEYGDEAVERRECDARGHG